jgi:hypothetical protein
MMLSIDASHVFSQPAELAVSKLCQWPLFCPELKDVQIVILCESMVLTLKCKKAAFFGYSILQFQQDAKDYTIISKMSV